MAIIHQSGAFGGYKNTGFGGGSRRRVPGTPAAVGPSPWAPPTSPPPGTYDPSLDFQGENQALGFQYAQQDLPQNFGRAYQDFHEAFNQASQKHLANLGALGQALSRANTDYSTNTQALGTSYANLGTAQAEKARAAGVASGGAALQSAQKRQANQSTDQGKLDQAIQRFHEDNSLATGQENQSWQSLVGALSGDTPEQQIMADPSQYGSLGQAYGRRLQDLTTGGDRAQAENALFTDQLNRAKTYSAQQAGLLPTLPSGSYATLPGGLQNYLFGGVNYEQAPGSQFLTPTGRPTAQSVLETGSLLGTDFAKRPPASYYHPKRKR